jgi:hypothetical protein
MGQYALPPAMNSRYDVGRDFVRIEVLALILTAARVTGNDDDIRDRAYGHVGGLNAATLEGA